MTGTDFTGRAVVVTGHRPDKLGGYSDTAFESLVRLAAHGLGRLSPPFVVTGMALGWDQAVAEACGRLGLPFHAYLPCRGQADRWPVASQRTWTRLLGLAAETVVCHDGPYPGAWCMQRRNERMVDEVAPTGVALAVFSGEPGGTANCVAYARSRGVTVLNMWERFRAGNY